MVDRFQNIYGGVTCQHLQQRFTGRTYDLWDARQYAEFSEARSDQCAHATGPVTQWVIERW